MMRARWMAAMAVAMAAGVCVAQDAAAPGQEREIGGVTFVWCPAGEFLCGSAVDTVTLAAQFGGDAEWYEDEVPQQKVDIPTGFWMSKTEVTRAQWVAVTNTRPWGESSEEDMALPVTMITWEEAAGFARDFGQRNEVGARLPLETEWEYACRAGSSTIFWWGDDAAPLELNAQYRVNASGGQPQHVGQRAANAWGLHDTLGNVWEWCQDKYAPKVDGEETTAGASVRVVRGGAANCTAALLRCSYRTGMRIDVRSPRLGMRLVVEP